MARLRYPATDEPPYRTDAGKSHWWNKRPSTHMPRWACRLVLEVVSVRLDRLQEISEDDAVAEGVDSPRCRKCGYTRWDCRVQMDHRHCGEEEPASAIPVFRDLWDSINAKRGYGWDSNPWVWVVEFRRVEEQA